jgi:hypothetical protein
LHDRSATRIDDFVSSPPLPDAKPSLTVGVDLADQLAVLQAELAAIKTETAVKVASLKDTIANLAHENTLLKRRLYGNRTERSHTSELQLALGDLLAGEAELQKALDGAIGKVKDALEPEPKPAGPRPTPKGRRDLSLSKLPRVVIEILHEELEANGCRRIGFEESSQLMFRRGGFAVLVKRVAKYEVIHDDEATVETVPSPETLFPRALLHSSAIAHSTPSAGRRLRSGSIHTVALLTRRSPAAAAPAARGEAA